MSMACCVVLETDEVLVDVLVDVVADVVVDVVVVLRLAVVELVVEPVVVGYDVVVRVGVYTPPVVG